jgi:hypothetical protein
VTGPLAPWKGIAPEILAGARSQGADVVADLLATARALIDALIRESPVWERLERELAEERRDRTVWRSDREAA